MTTPNSTVEAVARRICFANAWRHTGAARSPEERMAEADFQAEHAWDLWCDEARAAISAMATDHEKILGELVEALERFLNAKDQEGIAIAEASADALITRARQIGGA